MVYVYALANPSQPSWSKLSYAGRRSGGNASADIICLFHFETPLLEIPVSLITSLKAAENS